MNRKIEEIQQRHSAIKEAILSLKVYNQTQLVKILKDKKIKVTQATLSRDLAELGVIRVPTEEGLVYRIAADNAEMNFRNRVSEDILSIASNESLIIIKTFAGRAQGVALFIDRQNLSEILGTIAGDDTIIVAPSSVKEIKSILKNLKTLLGIK